MVDTTENKKKKIYDENYWMTVLIYFASFLIGLGIVAEIAFNWEQIPDNIKLSGALGAMIINAGVLIWAIRAEKKVLKQVLACLYAFLIMGVIGIIGQVFHLKADFARGCLAWSAVSWPLFLVAPRLLWLWLPLAFIGVNGWAWQSRSLIHGIESSSVTDVPLVPHIITVYCYLCLIGAYEIWVNFKKELQDNIVTKPLRFWSAVILLGIYSQTVLSLEPIRFGEAGAAHDVLLAFAWILPYLAMAVLVWLLNKHYERKSFMPLFLGGILAEFLFVLVASRFDYFQSHQFDIEKVIPVAFVISGAFYARYNKFNKLLAFCYFLLLIWFVIIWGDDIFDVVPCLAMCAFGARWFNVAVIAAVLRILGYYADVDNLQFFGLYLIGGGILILATILLLKKYGKLLWENRDEK